MFIHSFNKIFKISKALLPFLGLVAVFILFHFTNFFLLKYYPVCMNFALFLIFFLSIFRPETVIQKIAKATEPNLHPKELIYTRNLTYIWAAFCFANFLVSLWTVYLSKTVWYLYNGCISYILVGLLFGVEYIVRLNFKKKLKNNG